MKISMIVFLLSISGIHAEKISFNRDILPVLTEKCFTCHGPDQSKVKADLQLHSQELSRKALGKNKSRYAIIPGKPNDSELVKRIFHEDTDERMPPVESDKTLSEVEKQLLKRWISEGGEYEQHWSFSPITIPDIPKTKFAWEGNAIDQFILGQLEANNLKPSEEANRYTLIRRLSLDLTGLPPSIDEINSYISDKSENAYEKVVDRLLASKAYGEHRAHYWLDSARYADTHGLTSDNYRSIWPYRDWVIKAFNENKPFDRFTIEQLAGDLLPNATREQKVATGFNRCHPTTNENGSIEEEYLVRYMKDRADTTATVWLGLSMGCASCHDHKYDPITQKDYYRFAAFFNNTTVHAMDRDIENSYPFLLLSTEKQQNKLDALNQQKNEIYKSFPKPNSEDPKFIKWLEQAVKSRPKKPEKADIEIVPSTKKIIYRVNGKQDQVIDSKNTDGGNTLKLDGEIYIDAPLSFPVDSNNSFSISCWVKLTSQSNATILTNMDPQNYHRGWKLMVKNNRLMFTLSSVHPGNQFSLLTQKELPENSWFHVTVTYDAYPDSQGLNFYVDGEHQNTVQASNDLTGSIVSRSNIRIGGGPGEALFQGQLRDIKLFKKSLTPIECAGLYGDFPIRDILGKDTPENRRTAYHYYVRNVNKSPLLTELIKVERAINDLTLEIDKTLIMEDKVSAPKAHILKMGRYDMQGELVNSGIPGFLPQIQKNDPMNRLALAKWIVSDQNPLTARVIVNRFWQEIFGAGLVETPDDFGLQGSYPSHPKLLDFLSGQFRNSGWNIKGLIKYMVMSKTYRQSSLKSAESLKIDPKNRLLSHSSRLRLDAEVIRDAALKSSGLLINKIGGKPVKPYQPEGLWNEVAYSTSNTRFYISGSKEEMYRRSIYTFIKRTSSPPLMANFDAPNRQTCVINRSISNTPLQALQLLNDPQFLESALNLAVKLNHLKNSEEKIKTLFLSVLSRLPDKIEIEKLKDALSSYESFFKNNPNEAQKVLTQGMSNFSRTKEITLLASLFLLCHQVHNLDEAVTRE